MNHESEHEPQESGGGATDPSYASEDNAALEFHRRQELEASAMDGEEAIKAYYRSEALSRMADFERRVIAALTGFRTWPDDCLIFVLGFGHLIGCTSPEDLMRRHRLDPRTHDKQKANKWIQKLRRQIGLPPLPNQRKGEACTTMRARRLNQLKGKS